MLCTHRPNEGVSMHACHPSAQEAEAGGPCVGDQLGLLLQSDALSQNLTKLRRRGIAPLLGTEALSVRSCADLRCPQHSPPRTAVTGVMTPRPRPGPVHRDLENRVLCGHPNPEAQMPSLIPAQAVPGRRQPRWMPTGKGAEGSIRRLQG